MFILALFMSITRRLFSSTKLLYEPIAPLALIVNFCSAFSDSGTVMLVILITSVLADVSAPSSKLTSKAAAQIALTWVINALGTTNRGIKERPDLIVLNQTTVPAILIETCFISNPDDAAKVKSEENINKLANNIYSAISIMLNDYDLR